MSKRKIFRNVVALVTVLLLTLSTLTVGFAATTSAPANPTVIYAQSGDKVLMFSFNDLLNAYVNNDAAFKATWTAADIQSVTVNGVNVDFDAFLQAYLAKSVSSFAEYAASTGAVVDALPATVAPVAANGTVGTAVANPNVPVVNLAVDSVSATNLKEIVVKFNKAVNKDTVVVDNFTVNTKKAAGVALASDNQTVTVTLADADVAVAQPASYALVVQNVKDADGNAMAKYTQSVRAFDTTIPVAQSVEVASPGTFTITFSEPIKTAGTVKVNNGVYATTTNALDGSNKVTVKIVALSLPVGNYSVALTGFKDYAGFTMDSTNLTLAYQKVTTEPTATIKSVSQKQVVVSFDRPVTLSDTLENYFYHTFAQWVPSDVTTTDNQTYTVTFDTYYIPAGTTNFVIKCKTAAANSDIVDAWGNKVSSNIVLAITAQADFTAPTVTKVAVTAEDAIDLYFSESLAKAAAEDETNYAVKDATGAAVGTAFTATYSAADNKVTLKFGSKLDGGNYTVDVKNLTDNALAPNTIVAVTEPFTIHDLTPIDVTKVAATVVDNTSSDDSDIIYVTYPERMATTGDYSVLNSANYVLDNAGALKALPSGSTVELFGSTGKVVKITIPGADKQAVKGMDLVIGRVADASGNATTQLSFVANNGVAMDLESAPVVLSVSQNAYNKVVITMDKPMSVVLPTGFSTTSAAGVHDPFASIDSWTVDGNNHTVINATVVGDDASDQADTSDLLAGINVEKDILVSEAGVKAAAATGIAVKDQRVPTLFATNPIAGSAAGAKTATIKFSEDLDTAVQTLVAQDLTITDSNGNTLIAGIDYSTAIAGDTITVTFTTGLGKYNIKSKATITYIRDKALNKAATFSNAVEVELK